MFGNVEVKAKVYEIAGQTQKCSALLGLGYLGVATEAGLAWTFVRGTLECALAACALQGVREATTPTKDS